MSFESQQNLVFFSTEVFSGKNLYELRTFVLKFSLYLFVAFLVEEKYCFEHFLVLNTLVFRVTFSLEDWTILWHQKFCEARLRLVVWIFNLLVLPRFWFPKNNMCSYLDR